MAILRIITRENPNIFHKAKRVPKVDEAVRRLMDDMVDTMIAAPGVGLAATQVDVPLRVFVMKIDNQIYHLANPELVRAEGEQLNIEGCLSMPGWVGETRRAERVTVRGLNRNGKEIRVKGTGLLAQCMQHELDHLDGMLYTSRITRMETLRELGDTDEDAEDDDAVVADDQAI